MTAAAEITKSRRAYWYGELRAQGYDALSAWNGARATIRFSDAMRADAIAQFIADCAADDVECWPETAAAILEERAVLAGFNNG